jgi:hypothetical protein
LQVTHIEGTARTVANMQDVDFFDSLKNLKDDPINMWLSSIQQMPERN